jgi:hypothetical protein
MRVSRRQSFLKDGDGALEERFGLGEAAGGPVVQPTLCYLFYSVPLLKRAVSASEKLSSSTGPAGRYEARSG